LVNYVTYISFASLQDHRNYKYLNIFFYFVKLYHAGTVCARRRARLLVCFDRFVGWKQAVRLYLIKLMRLMRSNNGQLGLAREGEGEAWAAQAAWRSFGRGVSWPASEIKTA